MVRNHHSSRKPTSSPSKSGWWRSHSCFVDRLIKVVHGNTRISDFHRLPYVIFTWPLQAPHRHAIFVSQTDHPLWCVGLRGALRLNSEAKPPDMWNNASQITKWTAERSFKQLWSHVLFHRLCSSSYFSLNSLPSPINATISRFYCSLLSWIIPRIAEKSIRT